MKKYFFLLAFLLFSSVIFGQIKLTSGSGQMTFGGATAMPNYTVTSYGSLYLTGGTAFPSKFFQFDIFNGRIATTGNWCVFYNTQTSVFNDLAVGTVYNYSDARAKTNIAPIKYGLSTISKLRPVSYNLLKDPSGRSNHQELGLIAQEIEQVMPGLVRTDKEGKKLVNYNGLIPVLIKSIQELQKEVADLKARR